LKGQLGLALSKLRKRFVPASPEPRSMTTVVIVTSRWSALSVTALVTGRNG
jgi:hypothetical protein